MVRICLIFVMVHTLWATIISTSTAQHSNNNPFSLQPAIDALHRRAAQLALREYDNSHHDGKQHVSPNSISSDANDPEIHRKQQLNHLLAKYLERVEQEQQAEEEPYYDYQDLSDYDERAFEERKRSIFRERGATSATSSNAEPYSSVFRERGSENIPQRPPAQASPLANQFLREIDNERNVQREIEFRQNLARAIEKYEEDEQNAMEREAIAEELERNAIFGTGGDRRGHGPAHLQRKQIGAHWDGPSRELIEKRQMTLPWLPASRRKRFPISKRSPNAYAGIDGEGLLGGTSAKVARDLDALFGEELIGQADSQLGASDIHKVEKKSDRVQELQDQSQHHDDSMFSQIPTHPHMPSDDEDEHELEHDHELDHSHDHEHDHDHDHEHDDSDEDDDDSEFDEEDIGERKRKRSADSATVASKSVERHIGTRQNHTKANREEFKIEQVIGNGSDKSEQPLTDATNSKAVSIDRIPNKRKKAIEWSKYFGLDRKKKSVDDWFMSKHKSEQFERENPVNGRRPSGLEHERNNDVSAAENLDNIDQSLKSIENHIIDDTIKYTGSKQGITNSDEIENLKNHIVSRLATAYSLEKMRKALTKLREQRERSQHLDENEISDDDVHGTEKAKRVAIKKEKVEYDNNQHSVDSAASGDSHASKLAPSLEGNRFEEPPAHLGNGHVDADDDKKKKKKKRNGSLALDEDDELGETVSFPRRPYGLSAQRTHPNRFDLRDRDYDDLLNECPVLDAIDKRCQDVDMISGGGSVSNQFSDALLPACGVHQFCYLCGTSQTFCDFAFLSETDAICGSNRECQSTAHLVLMILRGSTSGPQQIGPKECAKNPCLLQAMRNSAVGY